MKIRAELAGVSTGDATILVMDDMLVPSSSFNSFIVFVKLKESNVLLSTVVSSLLPKLTKEELPPLPSRYSVLSELVSDKPMLRKLDFESG